MQTKRDRLVLLHQKIELDLSIIQDKYELLMRLASVPEGEWTEEHEAVLNKLESSFRIP